MGLFWGLLLGEGLLRILLTESRLDVNFERSAAYRTEQKLDQHPKRVQGSHNLVVVGDSVAFGVGAPKGKGFAEVLATKLQEATGERLNLINMARPGANIDLHMQAVRIVLRHKVADDLVLVFFSDDLDLGRVVARHGSIVDFLNHNPGLLARLLLEHSYLYKRLWICWQTLNSNLGDIDFLPNDRRRTLIKGLKELHRLWSDQEVRATVVLLPAAGLPLCEDITYWKSGCRLVPKTLETIAEMLDQVGIPYLDLSHIWDNGPLRLFEKELKSMPGGEYGVPPHPNTAGHELIAEKILPALLTKRKED